MDVVDHKGGGGGEQAQVLPHAHPGLEQSGGAQQRNRPSDAHGARLTGELRIDEEEHQQDLAPLGPLREADPEIGGVPEGEQRGGHKDEKRPQQRRMGQARLAASQHPHGPDRDGEQEEVLPDHRGDARHIGERPSPDRRDHQRGAHADQRLDHAADDGDEQEQAQGDVEQGEARQAQAAQHADHGQRPDDPRPGSLFPQYCVHSISLRSAS